MHYGETGEDDDGLEEFFSVQIMDDNGELVYEDIIEAYNDDDALRKAVKESGLDPIEYEYDITWLENYRAEKDIDWDGDREREESGI